MKLYLFPALPSLVALVPGVLTGIGIVALFFRTRRKLAFSLLALALVVGVGWTVYRRIKSNEAAGFVDIPSATLQSQPEHWKSLPIIWATATESKNLSAMSIAGTQVLIGTWDGFLEGYAVDTGKHQFRFRKNHPIYAKPLVTESNRILVGEGVHETQTAALSFLDLNSKRVLWTYPTHGHIEDAPLQSGSQIYFPTGDGGVHAIDLNTGKPFAQFGSGHSDVSPILIEGKTDLILIHAKNKTESFISRRNAQTQVWEHSLPGWATVSPLVRGSRLLVLTAHGRLGPLEEEESGFIHAIDAATGKTHWSKPLEGVPTSLVIAKGGFVIGIKATPMQGSHWGKLIRFDNEGRRLWEKPLSDMLVSKIVANETTVFALDHGGTLLAFDLRTGKEIRRLRFGFSSYSSPLLLEDGTILLAFEEWILKLRWNQP